MQSAASATAMMESRRLASRQLWPICVAGSSAATATPPRTAGDRERHRDRFAGTEDGAIERGKTFGCGGFVGRRAVANTLAEGSGTVPIGDAEAGLHQRCDPLQIGRGIAGQGNPLHLLQCDVPGNDFRDAAHLGLRDLVTVEQGPGRNRDEANRRERRDT